MVAYSIGLYISGAVGDRLDMRKVLTFGMCSSAICVFVFGVLSEWLHIYNEGYYVVFWILNGLLQSTGWPAMVAIMANWFGRGSRGFILGIWGGCASVGNVIGTLMMSGFLQYGYEYAFLIPASTLFAWGLITCATLLTSPEQAGLPTLREDESETAPKKLRVEVAEQSPLIQESTDCYTDDDESSMEQEKPSTETDRPEPIGFCQAFLLPGVALYSISYACLKFVNYAFFFWLPYYLASQYHWTQRDADQMSIWYDIGGIVVGIIAGLISDYTMKRTPVVVTMLVLAVPSLFIYSIMPNNKLYNAIVMAVTGGFIGGASTLISSAIAADLGRHESLRGSKEALATVTGIIDGTGSFGAAAGQILIPVIEANLGWHWVFYCFIVMISLTAIILLPILVREIRSTACCRRRFGHSGLISEESLMYDSSVSITS